MKLALNIIVGLVGLSIFIYSFVNPEARNTILGFEVNIWVYRAFWGLIGGLGLKDTYQYFQQRGKS